MRTDPRSSTGSFARMLPLVFQLIFHEPSALSLEQSAVSYSLFTFFFILAILESRNSFSHLITWYLHSLKGLGNKVHKLQNHNFVLAPS